MTINRNFPVFFANQVLRHDHLNDLVSYLDEQTRLTRTKTIGIGVVCGFQSQWDQAQDNLNQLWETLTVSEGVGITSEGFLINSEENSYSHYREYTRDMELSQLEQDIANDQEYTKHITRFRELSEIYPFFSNAAGTDVVELYELVNVKNDKDNAKKIDLNFLQDKVLLAYLNCDLQSLKNCDANDCDDKGAKLEFEVRFLLAPAKVALAIQKEELDKREQQDLPYLNTQNPYNALSSVSLEKLDFYDSTPVYFKQLFAQYQNRIKSCLSDFTKQTRESFNAYAFLLDPIYTSSLKDNMIDLINKHIVNVSNLNSTGQYQIQYYYDLCVTLIAAYEEFRSTACQLSNICSPNDNYFPKHLLLGTLKNIEFNLEDDNEYLSRTTSINTGEGFFPVPEKSIEFRHGFVSSPQTADQKELALKVKALHFKIYELLLRFDPALIINKTIKTIPGHSKSFPLSKNTAIPGYYKISNIASSFSHKLLSLWSYDKTNKNKLDQIYSYHTMPSPNPLVNVQSDVDFYRIEGHIGKDITSAYNDVARLRRELGLDFEIKIVKLGASLKKKYISDKRVELFEDVAEKHPAIAHYGGALKGGTYYLAYQEISTGPRQYTAIEQVGLNQALIDALATVNTNPALAVAGQGLAYELTKTSNKRVVYDTEIKEKYKELIDDPKYSELAQSPFNLQLQAQLGPSAVAITASRSNVVVADFSLSYVCCESLEDNPIGQVIECTYPWFDTYDSLGKYSWEGNANDYIINVSEYKIGGVSLLNSPRRIPINISALASQKLLAIMQAINLNFKSGLFFDVSKDDKGQFTIKHLENQEFKISISREGTNNTYTFTQDGWLKNGKEYYSSEKACEKLPLIYNEASYHFLHEHYENTTKFTYEVPPSGATLAAWEKAKTGRSVKTYEKLPSTVKSKVDAIYKELVKVDPNVKIGIAGSWKSGTWVNDDARRNEKEFVNLRNKFTGKSKNSDVDIQIETTNEKAVKKALDAMTLKKVSIIDFDKVDSQNHLVYKKKTTGK